MLVCVVRRLPIGAYTGSFVLAVVERSSRVRPAVRVCWGPVLGELVSAGGWFPWLNRAVLRSLPWWCFVVILSSDSAVLGPLRFLGPWLETEDGSEPSSGDCTVVSARVVRRLGLVPLVPRLMGTGVASPVCLLESPEEYTCDNPESEGNGEKSPG